MTRPLYLSARRPTLISTRPVSKTFPTASLVLADTDSGFLPNRLSTTQRDSLIDPPTSLLIFNTTENRYEFFDGEGWSPLGTGGGSDSTFYGQANIAQSLEEIFGLSNLSFYFPLDEVNFSAVEDRTGYETPLLVPEFDLEDIQMGVYASGAPDGRTGMKMHGVKLAIPYREELWGLKGNNGAWFFHVLFQDTYDFIRFSMYGDTGRRFRLEVRTGDNSEIRVYDDQDNQIHRSDFPEGFVKPGARALIGLIIDYDNTWRFMINEHVVTFHPDKSSTNEVSRTFNGTGYESSDFSVPITLEIEGGNDSPVFSHFFGYPGYGVSKEDISALLGAFELGERYRVGRPDAYVEEEYYVPLIGASVDTVFDFAGPRPTHHFLMNSNDYPSWDNNYFNAGGMRNVGDGNRPTLIVGGAQDGKHCWDLEDGTELIQTSYFPFYFGYVEDTHMILVDSLREDGGSFNIKAEHVDATDTTRKKWEVDIDFYAYNVSVIKLTYYTASGDPYIEVTSRLRPATGSKLCLMWGYSSKYDAAYLCVNGVIDYVLGGEGDVNTGIETPNQNNTAVRIYGQGVAVSHFASWLGYFIGEGLMRSITGALGYGRDIDYVPIQKSPVSPYDNTSTSVVMQHFNLEGNGIIESTGDGGTTVLLSVIDPVYWPIGGVLELCRVGAGEMVFRIDNGTESIYTVVPASSEGGWTPNQHGWRVPAQADSAFIRRRSLNEFIIQGAVPVGV